MLTYADVFCRYVHCCRTGEHDNEAAAEVRGWMDEGRLIGMYADVCGRMLMYADVCGRMLTYADVCWRMLTCADVC